MIKKIVAILLAVVAIAMIGSGIYMMNSGSYIFKTIVTEFFDYAVDSYVDLTESVDKFEKYDKYKVSTSLDGKIIDLFDVSVNNEVYADIKEEKFYINVEAKSDLTNENDAYEAFYDNDNLYLRAKEVGDIFYYVEIKSLIEEQKDKIDQIEELIYANTGIKISDFDLAPIYNLEEKEISRISNHLKDSILEFATDKKIKKSSETIKLDGKEQKLTKISLKISEKESSEIIISFLKSIGEDVDSIKILQKVYKSLTKKDINSLIDILDESISELSDEDGKIISFYVSTFGKLTRVSLEEYFEVTDEYTYANHMVVDIYKNKKGNDVVSYKQKTTSESSQNNDWEYIIEFEKINDTIANVMINSNGEEFNGTLEQTDKYWELKFVIPSEDGDGIIKVKGSKENDKEYKLEFSFVAADVVDIHMNIGVYMDEAFPDIDIENAKSLEDASESERRELSKYLGVFDEQYEDDNYDDSYWDDEDESYDTYYYEEITADEVEDLMNSSEPMVLWFGSQNCSYCADFAEVLDESYMDYWYDIYYIDIDDLTASDRETLNSLDSKLNVTSTPTTVVLQDGEVKEVKTGFMTKDEYYSFLDSYGIE